MSLIWFILTMMFLVFGITEKAPGNDNGHGQYAQGY